MRWSGAKRGQGEAACRRGWPSCVHAPYAPHGASVSGANRGSSSLNPTIRTRPDINERRRRFRVVPIFPALRPYLERAYRERKPGAEHVVPRAVGLPNLGTEADRIVEEAGFKPWEKTFTNLRGSCSDELEREYPAHVVDAWMGNSSRVRRRHYLKVTDADFDRAAGYPAHNPAHSAAFSGVQEPSTLHESREKTLDVQETAENQYPRQGSNL